MTEIPIVQACCGGRPQRRGAAQQRGLRHALAAMTALLCAGGTAMLDARTPDAPAAGTEVRLDDGRAADARIGDSRIADSRIVFPANVSQGALVLGKVPPGSTVTYRGRTLRVTGYGTVVFGVGRDEAGPLQVEVRRSDGTAEQRTIAVTPRDWPLERVRGVPPRTVNPPPAIAARIAREQAQVTAARERDDDRTDFTQRFVWPVRGRISGRFGNARLYVATDGSSQSGSGHSGMDIAAPAGTAVKAPAAGVVTFAAPDLYLTGGTLLIDHGHGVSSNFLHLSRIDVQTGDRVEQGQTVAAVGATGRATGPHLHWGMNWFDVRVDPLLVLQLGENR